MKAYILITVQTGMIPEVVRNLARLSGVHSAEMTFGEYDIVAIVKVADIRALAKLVSREIQPIPGVTHTITCMAIDINE